MKKQSLSKYSEALELAVKARSECRTGIEFWNRLFGIGGEISTLFAGATQAERTAFGASPEHARIMSLMDELGGISSSQKKKKDAPAASGKLSLRLPKSLHAALIAESEAEGVSINQLIVAKVATQLRELVN
jgi:predicted HicB family RNase H-like nuclease